MSTAHNAVLFSSHRARVEKDSTLQPLFLHPLTQTRGSPLDREILAETGYEDLARGSGILPPTAISRLVNM